MTRAVSLEWTLLIQSTHGPFLLLLPPVTRWVKLSSQVQGLLPGCTALPANGFSISPKPFWIDDYIGWDQVCISISHLDIALFKSLASKDWRFHFSPLCGCYTLPGANASGPLVCVEDSDDG